MPAGVTTPRIKFFDETRRFQRTLDRRNDRKLFQCAGYSAKVMKSTLNISRRKVSAPGSPPNVRSGSSRLRKMVRFDVDRDRKSFVVGPEKWGGSTGGPPVPGLLDQGGTVRLPKRRIQIKNQTRDAQGRFVGFHTREKELPATVARYRPRPFVGRTRSRSEAKWRDIFAE